VRTGTVNSSVVGTYMLTYEAADSHGNLSSDTRAVIVAANPPVTRGDCKSRGWQYRTTASGQPFPNQGQCIEYVNTGK